MRIDLLFRKSLIPQRILIVEDDPISRWLLNAILSRLGFDCRAVDDGFKAIEESQRFSPDVILMDLMMPKLDGLEATRRIKADQSTQGIRVMIISANATPWGELEARRAGCDEFMTKPIVVEKVVRWIQRQTFG